jgi:hypothetical protein
MLAIRAAAGRFPAAIVRDAAHVVGPRAIGELDSAESIEALNVASLLEHVQGDGIDCLDMALMGDKGALGAPCLNLSLLCHN